VYRRSLLLATGIDFYVREKLQHPLPLFHLFFLSTLYLFLFFFSSNNTSVSLPAAARMEFHIIRYIFRYEALVHTICHYRADLHGFSS
jgi:hypothetical protein